MLIILGVASVAIALWARWLVRAGRGHRGLLAIMIGVPALSALFGAWSQHRLREAFDRASDVNPAERTQFLSSHIASAMWLLVVPIAGALVAAGVLGYVTLRRSQRSS